MRTRFTTLTAALCGAAALAAPGVASATPPQQVDGLTIATAPSTILAGQSMLIYGQLAGPNNANQPVILYHKIAGGLKQFTVIQRTTTNSQGQYEFTRAEGVVNSDRSWYVTGPSGTHSNTVSEQVSALVTMTTNAGTANTGQSVVFHGSVWPLIQQQKVLIQEQDSTTGTGWKTIATTFTNGGSRFSLAKAWRTPDAYTLRAVVTQSWRNYPGTSDTLTQTVQQKENPNFTINSSSPVVAEGQPVTLTGSLNLPGTAGSQVTLWGKLLGGTPQAIATTTTAPSGSYTFTESPVNNTVYYVGSTLKPKHRSAWLFQGVQDQLTITPTSGNSTIGGSISFTGSVSPDKTGHEVILQVLGTDGAWQSVSFGTVATGSTYSLPYTFGEDGTFQMRTRIPGGPDNIGNVSPTATVTVTGVAPVSALPKS